jgi:hypothetical protein
MLNMYDPHRIDQPNYTPPGQRGREPEHAEMTISGRPASAPPPPPRPTVETPVGLAFKTFDAAVAAQRDLNAEVNAAYERRVITEQGARERKAAIRTSPAATAVDIAEQTVRRREAEARQRYGDRIEALTQPGDAAAELRNTRYLQRVDRELAAADSTGQKLATAQRLMEKARGAELGLLAEDLPSRFPGNTEWIEAKLIEVDPELGKAATEVRLATECGQMARYAAGRVRHGFATGDPPKMLGALKPAVERLDPDRVR